MKLFGWMLQILLTVFILFMIANSFQDEKIDTITALVIVGMTELPFFFGIMASN